MAKYRGKYIQKRSRGKTGLLPVVLLVLFAGMMAVGSWKLHEERQTYRVGTDSYTALAEAAVHAIPAEAGAQGALNFETTLLTPETGSASDPASPEPSAPRPSSLEVDFGLLQSINPQVVGWISGAGGAIHYPVVQGSDNDYYLDRLFDGTPNKNGSLFMDYRNLADLSHRNTFIYGHNMRNGSMFAALANYADPDYFRQNQELILITPDRAWSLQVFSGYVTPGNSDIYQIEFEDDAAFAAYVERIKGFSDVQTDVPVSPTDRIVTLSTCTYDYEDARYVVHCKLVPMQ